MTRGRQRLNRASCGHVWLLTCLFIGVAFAVTAQDDDPRRTLRDAERLKAEQQAIGKDAAVRADRAGADALRLSLERVEAAARLQRADAATRDAADRIEALATRRLVAERELKERAVAMQPLLPLIERLSLYPVETLLATPGSPEDSVRGVLVLKNLSRQIEIEAEALRQDQAALDALADQIRAALPALEAAKAEQSRLAEALDRQIQDAHAQREKAEAEATAAASQAAQAAARADSLRAALAALEAQQRIEAARAREEAERDERQKKPAEAEAARQRETMLTSGKGIGSMAGGVSPGRQLQAPVTGVVVKAWGEQTDGGPATGLSYHAPPGARVISPCGGRIVFADAFRSYGLLLIVDCGGGYHMVLAGFERLDVKLGQRVVAGEPVGVMPAWEPGANERRSSLYVELRHDGQPVNPAPWLRPSG
jgi:septal ring factor EnvC (AmiA/AmiB activator)